MLAFDLDGAERLMAEVTEPLVGQIVLDRVLPASPKSVLDYVARKRELLSIAYEHYPWIAAAVKLSTRRHCSQRGDLVHRKFLPNGVDFEPHGYRGHY